MSSMVSLEDVNIGLPFGPFPPVLLFLGKVAAKLGLG
jgi:hypothetical protein